MPLCLLVGNVPLFFFSKKDCYSFSTQCCPLVLAIAPRCALSATQKNNGFKWPFSHFFFLSLMKKYLSWMNLEILIFHFENKNCFNVSLKQYVFEILQLLGFFLGKEIICSCLAILSLVRVCHEVTFYFLWVSKWMAREKARGCVWEIFVSFWTLILLVWIIMSSLFSMSWL